MIPNGGATRRLLPNPYGSIYPPALSSMQEAWRGDEKGQFQDHYDQNSLPSWPPMQQGRNDQRFQDPKGRNLSPTPSQIQQAVGHGRSNFELQRPRYHNLTPAYPKQRPASYNNQSQDPNGVSLLLPPSQMQSYQLQGGNNIQSRYPLDQNLLHLPPQVERQPQQQLWGGSDFSQRQYSQAPSSSATSPSLSVTSLPYTNEYAAHTGAGSIMQMRRYHFPPKALVRFPVSRRNLNLLIISSRRTIRDRVLLSETFPTLQDQVEVNRGKSGECPKFPPTKMENRGRKTLVVEQLRK
jgi:hypothetical protein